MVYLTMTSTIVEALEKVQGLERAVDEKGKSHVKEDGTKASSEKGGQERTSTTEDKTGDAEGTPNDGEKQVASIEASRGMDEESKEPSLLNPRLGNQISHGQVIDLSRQLKAKDLSPRNLDMLLRGSKVYVPPPPPKPEPVSALCPLIFLSFLTRLHRPPNTKL